MQLVYGLNRYTSNYIAWYLDCQKAFKDLDIFEENDFDNCVSFAASQLIDSKEYLPQDLLQEIGLDNYNTAAELLDKRFEFARIALDLCNRSIFNTGVFSDNNEIIYQSVVDNIFLFNMLLFFDYLVNIYNLQKRFPENSKIKIKVLSTKDVETDLFMGLINEILIPSFTNIKFEVEVVDKSNVIKKVNYARVGKSKEEILYQFRKHYS